MDKKFWSSFSHKCYINWCTNKINVFDFHVGHDIPEVKEVNYQQII